ncbi:MAG: leucine-rich repeat protein [Clostridia bacterium]
MEIPNSVTYMGEEAFSGCNNLTSVKLSDNLKEIKDYSFSGCR